MVLKSTCITLVLMVTFSVNYIGSWPGPSILVPTSESNLFSLIETRIYNSLNEPDLKHDAFRLALKGFNSLKAQGRVGPDSVLTIIDYSLPSSVERLFVIDLVHGKLLFKSLVAHGRNSGMNVSTEFSNKPQSHKSSLGFFITGNTYMGAQGYSLTLEGVDKGFNDLARARSIVMHGADYATPEYVVQYGRLGRSLGCPALPPQLNAAIINTIKGGSVLLSYYPDNDYLNGSILLRNTFIN